MQRDFYHGLLWRRPAGLRGRPEALPHESLLVRPDATRRPLLGRPKLKAPESFRVPLYRQCVCSTPA